MFIGTSVGNTLTGFTVHTVATAGVVTIVFDTCPFEADLPCGAFFGLAGIGACAGLTDFVARAVDTCTWWVYTFSGDTSTSLGA